MIYNKNINIEILTNILQSYKNYSLGETSSLSPKLIHLISI
jgi:hypothetical protein|eukprot:COSAG06_NODE_6968_length_2687_cov_812.940224_3_plen_41_part_00